MSRSVNFGSTPAARHTMDRTHGPGTRRGPANGGRTLRRSATQSLAGVAGPLRTSSRLGVRPCVPRTEPGSLATVRPQNEQGTNPVKELVPGSVWLPGTDLNRRQGG